VWGGKANRASWLDGKKKGAGGAAVSREKKGKGDAGRSDRPAGEKKEKNPSAPTREKKKRGRTRDCPSTKGACLSGRREKTRGKGGNLGASFLQGGEEGGRGKEDLSSGENSLFNKE